MYFRFRCFGRFCQEAKIATFVSLRDLAFEQLSVTTSKFFLRRLPGRAAAVQLIAIDVQMQPPRGDVQFNQVAVVNQCQRAAGRCFG